MASPSVLIKFKFMEGSLEREGPSTDDRREFPTIFQLVKAAASSTVAVFEKSWDPSATSTFKRGGEVKVSLMTSESKRKSSIN